jgi:chemotaxis protein MotB
MARRHKHEEHANHEAWAIPYGDLITLLLAFFVVMYAISSINEGKFRVLSDSLNAAFRGNPKSFEPVQIGERSRGMGSDMSVPQLQQALLNGDQRNLFESLEIEGMQPTHPGTEAQSSGQEHPMVAQLSRVADELENALAELVQADLVTVRRHQFWLEVEIKTDILFPSGVATLSSTAYPALDALAATLTRYPNPLRVEGHTDNLRINTRLYPSNWELSAARAASVVHRFQQDGIAPSRLSVIGFGEFRPAKPNDTVAGRGANRRVIIVILSGDGTNAPADSSEGMADEATRAGAAAALPPLAAGSPVQTNSNNSETSTASAPSAAPPGAVGTESAPVPVTVGTGGGNPARE